jgi:hypothetical protein
LIVFGWLLLCAKAVLAHDPGLSVLDVSVSRDGIWLSLSIAEADIAQLAPGPEAEVLQRLSRRAGQALRVSLDGRALAPVVSDAVMDDGGARIQFTFAMTSREESQRLSVESDIPKQALRGHRQLISVTVDGQLAAERLLDAASDSVVVDVEAPPRPATRGWSFLVLGVRHILSGYDHLVFVAGLILAACAVPAGSGFRTAARDLTIALTAFTAAHSVSLALVTAGGVHAPSSIVEPLIAASVAWVGIENLLRGRRNSGTSDRRAVPRARWLVVFGFGLVHGFGFAGALQELGFGSSAADVATALLSFNVGVEAGQLAAATATLPIVWVIRAMPVWGTRLLPVCSAAIAVAGGCWLIVRLP